MRAAGIIAEYNPFHNGHERHIRETRRRTGCDRVIVVMNGSFSQRGEPMLLDKWTRAQMALQGGADFVFELPALWGVRPAENFALGGVDILHVLGCEWLSFGCETEELALLLRLTEILEAEPEEYKRLLRAALAQGKSFARARGEALAALTGAEDGLLSAPNVALGLEYLRALRRLKSAMRPVAVLRGAEHHAQEIAPETSALAIRAAVLRGETACAQIAMPAQAVALLRQNVGAIARPEAMDIALLLALRALPMERLAALPDVAEGLENVLWRACRETGSRQEMLERCKSRRYTFARLSRIAAHGLIGTDQGLLEKYPRPTYARLLGIRKDALPLLGKLEKKSALPIVIRAKALEKDECFALERRATDARALCSAQSAYRAADGDWTHRLVITD